MRKEGKLCQMLPSLKAPSNGNAAPSFLQANALQLRCPRRLRCLILSLLHRRRRHLCLSHHHPPLRHHRPRLRLPFPLRPHLQLLLYRRNPLGLLHQLLMPSPSLLKARPPQIAPSPSARRVLPRAIVTLVRCAMPASAAILTANVARVVNQIARK